MQRQYRNLAVALVAGTLALAAGAQDKAEKAPKKASSEEKAASKKASSGSGRIVVNGVTIPASRVDAMNKELTAQGQPESAERLAAVREELINREVLAQAAQKRGLEKNPDIQAQMEMARQAGCASVGVSYGAHEPAAFDELGPLHVAHSVHNLHDWLLAHG